MVDFWNKNKSDILTGVSISTFILNIQPVDLPCNNKKTSIRITAQLLNHSMITLIIGEDKVKGCIFN